MATESHSTLEIGSTDVSRYVRLIDSATFTSETGYTITNLDLQYIRNEVPTRVDKVAKVDATALSAITDAHSDNKALEVTSENNPGIYRVDWPDAAFASGADRVVLMVTGAGLDPAIEVIRLVDSPTDREAAATAAIVANKLDHLTGASYGTNDITNNSIMAKLVSNSVTADFDDYDHTTDSLMAHKARVEGSGFSTNTDSLRALRDAFDNAVAPVVTSSSALSGSGFLSDLVSLIRKATDEPSTSPKYTDSDIVELIQAAMDTVLTDIHVRTDHPILIRHNITLVSGTQDYVLPPGVGQLLRVAKINSSSNLPEWEAWPGSYFDMGGTGWKLEGRILRLLSDWKSTDTIELLYIPSADALMHKATASAVASTSVTFPASVTDGTLDIRPNAYVGMTVKVLSSTENIQEERLITAYDVATRVATIAVAWDTTPTGTLVYEVTPLFSRLIKHVVALRTSIDILTQEGNEKRVRLLERNYQYKLVAMRRSISSKEARFPHHFDGDTSDNDVRGGL